MVETRLVKDMRDIALRTELRLHIPAIAKVDIDTRHIVTADRQPPREADHRPIVEAVEIFSKATPDNAGSPGDQRFLIRFHA